MFRNAEVSSNSTEMLKLARALIDFSSSLMALKKHRLSQRQGPRLNVGGGGGGGGGGGLTSDSKWGGAENTFSHLTL